MKRYVWLVICCACITSSVATGLVVAALAWRGMWVQSCEGDVYYPRKA